MSKRSISITTSSANRSHNHHLSTPAAVVSGKQSIPGLLAISGLDLRPQPAGRGSKISSKPPSHSNSPASKRKHPRPRDALSASASMPATFHSQNGGSSNFPSPSSIGVSHPSGRLARGKPKGKTRSLSDVFAATLPNSDDVDSDPFVSSSVQPLDSQALSTLDTKQPFVDSSTTVPISPSPSRRRPPKMKLKSKADRKGRTKERRKESKHLRSAMKDRVAEGIPSDSAPEDMLIDLEDVAIPSQPPEHTSASATSTTPTTPPPSRISYGFPSTSDGVSAPISVPQPTTARHDISPLLLRSQRPRNYNSTPSTPPRQSSIQPSATARTLPPSTSSTVAHTRSPSHPFLFSASAPSSPSHPLTLGARYANSTFQHSPSPNVLPKPKFLETVFMEVDEVL